MSPTGDLPIPGKAWRACAEAPKRDCALRNYSMGCRQPLDFAHLGKGAKLPDNPHTNRKM